MSDIEMDDKSDVGSRDTALDLDDFNFSAAAAGAGRREKALIKREGRGRCLCVVVAVMLVAIVVLAVVLVVVLLQQRRTGQNKQALVSAQCGPVQGMHDSQSDSFAFKGIPFAMPPTGQRRWRPPFSLSKDRGTCWDDTLKAFTFGAQCPQKGPQGDMEGDEDCLYLDVYTPSLGAGADLPVMVYIHGGFLQFGNASTKGYTPDETLARKHNMVYVSIQYRLNALGFLVLEALPNRTGNYGLLDQIEALKWVKDNIREFGGNPDQVTVFGQSSGGTSVWALLMSPMAKGLFHRAWMISPSPYFETPMAEAEQRNRFVLDVTGCQTEECLYNLDAYAVAGAVKDPEHGWSLIDAGDLPEKNVLEAALLVIDGDVIPDKPFDMWASKSGVYSDVPVIIGTTAQELDYDPTPGRAMLNWTWTDLEIYTRSKLDTFDDQYTDQLLALYAADRDYDPQFMFANMVSDVRVNCGCDILAENAATALENPVYRYVVTSFPSSPFNAFGVDFPAKYAFHALDAFAFFDAMEIFMKNGDPQESDHAFRDTLTENILEFVKTGRPKDSQWLPYPHTTALIADKMTYSLRYHENQCRFWLDNGFFRYSWIN